jgi:tetratricopeptide (TPR) repeat protein
MEVGMVVTACEMFKKLRMWPLAMDCLAVSGRKSEALELLDSLEPLNARLLCSKGDMTGDIEYYEQAWEKSLHTNARSQRSIGRMKLKNQDLEGAAIAFELSLEINPLFDDIWYSLGCIYLKLEESDKAIRAFLRCVSVNPEHVQAWVNLSAVYSSPDFGLQFIKEAKNAASEAVKISSQAWQFWENYVLISAKAQDWQTVIQGERRLSLTLDRPDHPDMAMISLLHAKVTDKNTRIRLLSLLEDLVLRNKQTSEILKFLANMYMEFDRYEESFKTNTALLKELFSLMQDIDSTTRKTGKNCQNLVDEISECLQHILDLLGREELSKVQGLTTGLGLTVRSIPRRVAAINNGIELPSLKNLCDMIQTSAKNRDRLVE